MEEKVSNNEYPEIRFIFGNAIDYAIFLQRLVERSLPSLTSKGADYSREWSRQDYIQFFNTFIPIVKCKNFELNDKQTRFL